MSKTKRLSVSKEKLAETGEALEIAGTMAEIEGVDLVATGMDDLEVAKTAAAIGVAEVAAGASDLTRAADAAVVAGRAQELSEIVGAAGIVDVAEGVDMLMKGGDVRAMGAIVSLMSKEELERGLELARMSGELWTVSEVVDMLDMPVLAEFLDERGMRLQEIAVDQLLRYTGTRALAGALKQTGGEIEAMGEQEVAEGAVRMAISEVAAERSQELSRASDALAARGVAELVTADMARDVARTAAAAGVTEIAAGAEMIGAGETAEQVGEVLETRVQILKRSERGSNFKDRRGELRYGYRENQKEIHLSNRFHHPVPLADSDCPATWLVPAGSYDYDAEGAPIPGTYHAVEHNPQKLLASALKGPINGMYGIEDETGNVDVWNYGELFGAIDVAMFVLIIGGFLGVTMKTGAINAGIAWVVGKLKGKEKWMFPILMTIFAIGGTTYGMAEETLAFYALIITVMLAAGYDGLTAGALILLGAGIGVIGSTVNPFATGIASGFAGTTISEGLIGRVVILVVGTIIGIIFVMRYGEKVKKDPIQVADL